jgi:hypothetical protein
MLQLTCEIALLNLDIDHPLKNYKAEVVRMATALFL